MKFNVDILKLCPTPNPTNANSLMKELLNATRIANTYFDKTAPLSALFNFYVQNTELEFLLQLDRPLDLKVFV